MIGMNLELQGIRTGVILVVLLGGISVLLCACGVVHCARRRWWSGTFYFAAAAGPAVFLPVLLIDGGLRWFRRDRIGARIRLLLGGGGMLVALAVLLPAAGSDAAGAMWMALLGIQLIIAVGVIYSEVYANLGPGRLSVLVLLRVATVVALLLLLFKPAVLSVIDPDAHKPILPVVVDRSGSMATIDEGSPASRHQQAVVMLQSQLKRIEKHFRPVWLGFAIHTSRADSLADMEKLPPTGPGADGTDISTALRKASNTADPAQLAGVLLISDGINNAPTDPVEQARRAGAEVYTVGVGAATAIAAGRPNLELLAVEAPLTATVNNVAQIKARVRIRRFANVSGVVRLYEGDSTVPVATEKIWTSANDATVTTTLKWTPRSDAAGKSSPIRRLRVEVARNKREALADDNASDLHVLISDPKIRLLYVEGTIRPEYKYLRRLLQTDPNVEFLGLVRVAENRFWAQGNIGGVRLAGLPVSEADFKLFNVIILGDLDSSFLTRRQMARLRKFVSDGGGLLMLGGRSSFGPGGYGGTDIEAALPVEAGPRSVGQEATPFLPRLTAVGENHPILSGIAGYFPGPAGRAKDAKQANLPELRGCVVVRRAKPAAAVLAVHPTRRNEFGPLAVLVVQRYGAGRSAAFTADTTWQWYLPMRALGGDSPYARFWGQMIRWLGGVETKTRQAGSAAMLRLERTYARLGAGPVRLLARVRDKQGRPAAAGRIFCRIVGEKPAAAEGEIIPLIPAAGPGLFRAGWTPVAAGKYVVKLQAVGPDGQAYGTDELSVNVIAAGTETERLARDDKLLQDIATASGGQFVDISALPDLLDKLIGHRLAITGPPPPRRIYRLYNVPVLFVLFVALLTGEWLLRRMWQLQ